MTGSASFSCVFRDAEDRILHVAPSTADTAKAAAAEAELLCGRLDPVPHVYEVWEGDSLVRRALSLRDGFKLPIG